MKNQLNEQELQQKFSQLPYQYKLAIFTDKADFVDKIDNIQKLLEIRIFDKKGEFRGYRDVVGVPFTYREICHEKDKANFDGYYDKTAYIDIDTTKGSADSHEKMTTGGGKFHLPEAEKEKTMLLIRYYYRFDEDGIARKCDWCLLGFTDKEKI